MEDSEREKWRARESEGKKSTTNVLQLKILEFIWGVICSPCSHLPYLCGLDTSYKNTYSCYRLHVIGGSSSEDNFLPHSQLKYSAVD